MRKVIPAAFILASSIFISSCASLTPITDTIKTNNGWNAEQLKHIQYYLSDDILLQRKLKDGTNMEIASGKVKIVNGERIEEVLFKAGTPGVLLSVPADNRLGVSFEDGDSRFLMFVPNPDRNGKYVLAASDWKNGVGKVNYDGKEFYCTPESGHAYLEIDLKKINKVDRNARQAAGRKIDSDTPPTAK